MEEAAKALTVLGIAMLEIRTLLWVILGAALWSAILTAACTLGLAQIRSLWR